MTAKAVLIQDAVAAMNVDSWNRHAQSTVAMQNGYVMQLASKTGVSGESEVWLATVPASGAGLKNLWMCAEPEVVVTNAQYKGLDPDPRNFEVAIGTTFNAFMIKLGDIITVNAEAIAGTLVTGDYAVASNGVWRLTWAASGVSGVTFYRRATTYMSIADGTIASHQITAYELECIALA
jgi:hypothetical protein